MAVLTKAQKLALICAWVAGGQAKEWRESADLSFQASADKCKVTKGAVLRWEQGVRRPQGRNIDIYYRFLRQLSAQASSRQAD